MNSGGGEEQWASHAAHLYSCFSLLSFEPITERGDFSNAYLQYRASAVYDYWSCEADRYLFGGRPEVGQPFNQCITS